MTLRIYTQCELRSYSCCRFKSLAYEYYMLYPIPAYKVLAATAMAFLFAASFSVHAATINWTNAASGGWDLSILAQRPVLHRIYSARMVVSGPRRRFSIPKNTLQTAPSVPSGPFKTHSSTYGIAV